MNNKIIETLDLTNCKDWYDFHERIRIAFDFPECYGKNWDAFIDFMKSECDADIIIIVGCNTISKKLISDVEKMKELLDREKMRREKHGEKLEMIYRDVNDTDIKQFKF